MDSKKNIKILWNYLSGLYEPDELNAGFESSFEEFWYSAEEINDELIDSLPSKEADILLFDISYMALNELFGGDFDTWNEVLSSTLHFDDETINFLNY